MQVQIATCEKCGHQWIMRVSNPLKCPKCGHVRGTSVRNKKAAEPHPGKADSTALAPTTTQEVRANGNRDNFYK